MKVKIKPLEWEQYIGREGHEFYFSTNPFRQDDEDNIFVDRTVDGRVFYSDLCGRKYKTLDEAKAKLEAEYREMVLSLLDLS